MIAKRLLDILVSVVGLVALSPLLLLLSFAIKWDSPGPILFRQVRVGRYGRLFRIHKFRTMYDGPARAGLQLTAGRDPRITPLGHLLRRYKLDELPQLIDVLLGDMSLVGPRPEVPQFIENYPPAIRAKVLSVRPGITDWASIRFRSEGELLGRSADPEQTYLNAILPSKQQLYVDYVENRSFLGDLHILFATIMAVVRPGSRPHTHF